MNNINIQNIISTNDMNSQTCQLCNSNQPSNKDKYSTKISLIFSNKLFRVVRILDPDYLGYIQLIVNKHVREMTDLPEPDRVLIFSALLLIEQVLLKIIKPYKINLVSLGNIVPHVHWHIIGRYKNDKHFPNSIWGAITNPTYTAANLDLNELDKALYNLLDIKFNKN